MLPVARRRPCTVGIRPDRCRAYYKRCDRRLCVRRGRGRPLLRSTCVPLSVTCDSIQPLLFAEIYIAAASPLRRSPQHRASASYSTVLLVDRRTAPPPSSARSPGRGGPGSNAPCGVSHRPHRGSCRRCLAPASTGRHVRPTAPALACAPPASASSRPLRIAEVLGLATCKMTSQARASTVITGSRPGRALSSSAASTPFASARSTQRCTV